MSLPASSIKIPTRDDLLPPLPLQRVYTLLAVAAGFGTKVAFSLIFLITFLATTALFPFFPFFFHVIVLPRVYARRASAELSERHFLTEGVRRH